MLQLPLEWPQVAAAVEGGFLLAHGATEQGVQAAEVCHCQGGTWVHSV